MKVWKNSYYKIEIVACLMQSVPLQVMEMCISRKHPYPPQGWSVEILIARGVSIGKIFKESVKLNWKLQRGGRVQTKEPPLGEVRNFLEPYNVILMCTTTQGLLSDMSTTNFIYQFTCPVSRVSMSAEKWCKCFKQSIFQYFYDSKWYIARTLSLEQRT